MEDLYLDCTLQNLSEHENLGIEIWFDTEKLFDCLVPMGVTKCAHVVPCEDGPHTLQFCLKGKTSAHTKIGTQGEIVSDALINISDIYIDKIKLDQLVHKISRYTHDTNGTLPVSDHNFYGDMGCNGAVILDFYTPMYLWLLEAMDQ